MSTILLSGVGSLGGWALELLARTPGIERIVTMKRGPWVGPSLSALAMIGSVFQGHTKAFEHHQVDLAETGRMVELLMDIRPDAILHSATVQSPRRLMQADIDPGLRRVLRSATFGMWLPWHLLPAAWLTEAVEKAGLDTQVVNAAFPDVVNVALWHRYGHGPSAGAGNVEICASRVLRHVMDTSGADVGDVEIFLVGSHALLSYGPGSGVPHYFRVLVKGRDVTSDYDLEEILSSWPERIDWKQVDVFSLFAASAVKNVTALLGVEPIRTHVTSPNGLPGGYPAVVGDGRIDLHLPDGLGPEAAIALNRDAARWDGIETVESDGTVVYTREARSAMAELGYECDSIGFDQLRQRSEQLGAVYQRLTRPKENNA